MTRNPSTGSIAVPLAVASADLLPGYGAMATSIMAISHDTSLRAVP